MSKRIYFPGLNAVRFFAAFLVIIDHLELFKSYLGIPTWWADSYSTYLGKFGVTIFFVLSGYLITYLLLVEKEVAQINIKHFYIRRVLRIWPLYFILILIGFFIAPHLDFLDMPNYSFDLGNNFLSSLLLFVFLMANVAFVYLPLVPFANVLWSVAVEEQFYAFAPHLIKYSKYILLSLFACMFLYMAVKVSFALNIFHMDQLAVANINSLIDRTRFSCMLIGCIGAYIVHRKWNNFLSIIYHPISQLTALVVFTAFMLNLIPMGPLHLLKNEISSAFILILLINISTNPKTFLQLENKPLNFLGKISYGLYVYHLFAAVICIKLLAGIYPATFMGQIFWQAGLWVSTLLLSVLISHLSYTYIEKRFLSLKKSFSNILSGDHVGPENKETPESVAVKVPGIRGMFRRLKKLPV